MCSEGALTESLFDPDYAHAHLLEHGFVPALGIAIPWTLYVLTLHTVWSIGVPILLVEEMAGERRTRPWLGRAGLPVVILLVALAVTRWSARPGWGRMHRLALGAAGLLTYAWHAFLTGPLVPASPGLVLVSHVVFALGAVVLVAVEIRAAQRTERRAGVVAAPVSATAGR